VNHPLLQLTRRQRARLFRRLLVFTFINMIALQWVGGYLNTGAAPLGIVSYEFIESTENAAAIIASWREAGAIGYAWASFILDFPFLLLYSTTIALGCLWTSDVLRDRALPFAAIGLPLAWGQWLAAVLDATENTALMILLMQANQTDPWPAISYGCAAIKFALVGAGLLYALYGAAARLAKAAPNTSAPAAE